MSAQKPRKALADSLAAEFVYNASSSDVEAEQTKDISEKESSLMSKLNLPQKEATIRLSVDLPLSLNQKLSELAHKTGRKKAEIVRLLLDEAFKND